jgi:hypothetical protein
VKQVTKTVVVLAAFCQAAVATAQPGVKPGVETVQTAATERFLLGPANEGGPVTVQSSFLLHDINEINDDEETFEFTGVLTLRWHDERQAFDPQVTGADEKVYQGAYQFNEVFTGWYPQVVLVNESGMYEKNGVVLRVTPDGGMTLIETLNATAEAEFDMRRFPFDKQRLQAVFEVLGFDREEVALEADASASSLLGESVRIPQWTVTGLTTSVRDRHAPYAGSRGAAAAFVVSIDVERQSLFMRRLVYLPLVLIVLLSFSVFWMDRSSLGDRISVSFIGILSAVAYQIVMSDILPRISYVTLMNAFLNISFLTLCATVVINLVVNAYDQKGQSEVGDRIDRRCRWIFPLTYFALIIIANLTALVLL